MPGQAAATDKDDDINEEKVFDKDEVAKDETQIQAKRPNDVLGKYVMHIITLLC